MSFRVLLPAAGTGSRLGPLTRYLNKALVGIAHRPTISHIIEQFPLDTEFVVALGYRGDLLKQFLTLTYPDRIFIYEIVIPYEGEGSGLGLSVLKCKKHLQQPFIFTSCDTLVNEHIPAPDHNWMGYADLTDTENYRAVEIESGNVKNILEKGKGNPRVAKPYIGLAGILDYVTFWETMEKGGDEAVVMGESFGLHNLISAGMKGYCFTWFDTGNIEALNLTRKAYQQADEPNILEKENEAIWFIEDRVIKYSDDVEFISNRVKRAREIESFVPKVVSSTANMYHYKKADGEVLSKVVTLPIFKQLLSHSQLFWQRKVLTETEKSEFIEGCKSFYEDKTKKRIQLFYKKFNKKDGQESINGQSVPSLEELLNKIDWDWLANGLPGRFHGDYHFENILYSAEKDNFVFLDWRQEFAGSLAIGDIYYDFAKLLHGLIISHELIAANHFWIEWQSDKIRYEFYRKQMLVDCEDYFSLWLSENGYDIAKVRTLTALIYLNIAALHHHPYGLILFALGKKMLYDNIKFGTI
jgi:NDP-sugar pyrophosphorylase family protein